MVQETWLSEIKIAWDGDLILYQPTSSGSDLTDKDYLFCRHLGFLGDFQMVHSDKIILKKLSGFMKCRQM